jgi:hypothetical protein
VIAVLAAGAGGLGAPVGAVPAPVALPAALAYAWGLATLPDGPGPAPGARTILLWLGWIGLGWLLPAPWNLLTLGSVIVLVPALIGRRQPALLARRTAWLGGLALTGAVAALLLG